MRQCQYRRHRVYVLRRCTVGEAVAEPVSDDLECPWVFGPFVELPDAIKTDAVGPLPVIPSLGVDDAAVGEPQQELTALVLDVLEIADEQLDVALHIRAGNGMSQGGHALLSPDRSRVSRNETWAR